MRKTPISMVIAAMAAAGAAGAAGTAGNTRQAVISSSPAPVRATPAQQQGGTAAATLQSILAGQQGAAAAQGPRVSVQEPSVFVRDAQGTIIKVNEGKVVKGFVTHLAYAPPVARPSAAIQNCTGAAAGGVNMPASGIPLLGKCIAYKHANAQGLPLKPAVPNVTVDQAVATGSGAFPNVDTLLNQHPPAGSGPAAAAAATGQSSGVLPGAGYDQVVSRFPFLVYKEFDTMQRKIPNWLTQWNQQSQKMQQVFDQYAQQLLGSLGVQAGQPLPANFAQQVQNALAAKLQQAQNTYGQAQQAQAAAQQAAQAGQQTQGVAVNANGNANAAQGALAQLQGLKVPPSAQPLLNQTVSNLSTAIAKMAAYNQYSQQYQQAQNAYTRARSAYSRSSAGYIEMGVCAQVDSTMGAGSVGTKCGYNLYRFYLSKTPSSVVPVLVKNCKVLLGAMDCNNCLNAPVAYTTCGAASPFRKKYQQQMARAQANMNKYKRLRDQALAAARTAMAKAASAYQQLKAALATTQAQQTQLANSLFKQANQQTAQAGQGGNLAASLAMLDALMQQTNRLINMAALINNSLVNLVQLADVRKAVLDLIETYKVAQNLVPGTLPLGDAQATDAELNASLAAGAAPAGGVSVGIITPAQTQATGQNGIAVNAKRALPAKAVERAYNALQTLRTAMAEIELAATNKGWRPGQNAPVPTMPSVKIDIPPTPGSVTTSAEIKQFGQKLRMAFK